MIFLKALDIGCFVSKKVTTYKITAIKDLVCDIGHEFGISSAYGNTCAGGGVLPYMGYIGMCRCERYGFQAVYSRIGYINQRVWV